MESPLVGVTVAKTFSMFSASTDGAVCLIGGGGIFEGDLDSAPVTSGE